MEKRKLNVNVEGTPTAVYGNENDFEQGQASKPLIFGIRNKRNAYIVTMGIILLGLVAVSVGGYFIVELIRRERATNNNNNDDILPGDCSLTFGGFCGCVGNVPAYSNCNGAYTSNLNNFIEARQTFPNNSFRYTTVYTGMQFQCVEYARRFLINSTDFGRYVTFESVVGASNIFALQNLTSIFDDQRVYEFEAHVNGAANNTAPAFGDLIIYPIQAPINEFPFGHVAVIAYVNYTSMVVGVGEQNWNNNVWPASATCDAPPAVSTAAQQYAREIPLIYNATANSYRLQDHTYLIDGWKRIGALR
eukprot:GILI01016499.1.p1 GENE.GILI01016499.1~~GILI01016499.1.p1  ORF type:complete len:319 (-),score=44.26 GILI01016499.1:142-1056(-)